MKVLSLLLSLLSTSVFGTKELTCNTCEDPQILNFLDNSSVEHKICKFETTFDYTVSEPVDWMFLGIECDDNCEENPNTSTEGFYCNRLTNEFGFYELENGNITNQFTKIEFSELKCKFDETLSILSIDRYMPNLWLFDVNVTYYFTHGLNGELINPTSTLVMTY